MKKIRIGNDILIRWAITRNGEAEDFAGLSTLRVSVIDEIGARQKAEYSVSGNTITIQYRGANQKKNGVYSLLLEENRGIDGMVTLDHIEAFELVPHSAYTGGNTCSNIGIETVELSSDIDVAQGSILEHPYKSLRRLGEYLYEMTFATLPQYVPSNSLNVGGCTSFVRDGKLYRNLDWKYDETPTFIVRTKDFEGMAFDNAINDGNMLENVLGQLPYRIVDGCNRHGIMGSVHVLYNDFNWHGNGSIPLTKVLYEVLTRVTSMQSVQSELSDIIGDLATTPALDAAEYLLQFVITDGTTTYVLTPTADGYELVDITTLPKLTNFKWIGKRELERDDEDLQERPTGVERWNFVEAYTLDELRFSICYKADTRLSEFIGIDGTTKDSTDEELEEIYERAHAAYQTRTRDGQLWQTMHSVVYGPNGIEHLWTQENWDVDFVAQGGGGEFEQVQANWNQNDNTKPDYIKNKPTIPDVSGLATKTELNQGLSEKQNTISDLNTIRTNAQAGKNANDTISGYGDIVTHDTNEFATSEQGAKAETALQSSALIPYRTSAEQDVIDDAQDDSIEDIESKIPNQATSSNQLADKNFVNSSLNSITAFYITKDAQGTQFATKAQLDSTTTFYSGGEVRVPTRNDYCIVLADETKTDPVTGENPTTRYIYQNGWEFQYIVNKTTLTSAQLAAINSGITSGKVTQYDGYATGKQDKINDLEEIRNGAAAGATAYQKPSTGIAETDLASAVITKLNNSNVYICTYGVTTYQQIIDAIDAGKHPLCLYNGILYAIYRKESLYATLSACYGNYISVIKVSKSNVWSIQSTALQILGLRTSWASTPDDTHYPSEKLVKDSLDLKINEPSNEGTNGQVLATDGNGGREWITVSGGGISSHDFTISNLTGNTTSFTFPVNQRCYQKVSIAASATLNFAVENMADNYVRVYNSGSSEITLAIGTVTHNSTAVAAKVGPAEIKCGVGKYVEISVIYDGSDATFTASDNLQILS